MSRTKYRELVDQIESNTAVAKKALAEGNFPRGNCQQYSRLADDLLDKTSFNPDKIKDPLFYGTLYGTDADATTFFKGRELGTKLRERVMTYCLVSPSTLSAAPKRRHTARRRKVRRTRSRR